MRRILPLLAVLASAAACSSSTAAEPAPPVVTPEVDAGPGEPEPEPPCAPPALTFKSSPVAIAPARDHHFTMVREVSGVPYLYVLGGEKDDFTTVFGDIQRAKIAEDGSLGAFEPAGEIPNGRAGAGFAVVGDDVVLLGGVVGVPQTGFTNEILVARFSADGKLTSWKPGPSKLPLKVQHSSAVVVGRDVYVFGGTTGNAAATISGKVTVNADGTLGTLVSLNELKPGRSHQAAFVAQGSVYLVGGLDKGPIGNPPSRADVVRATFQPDGAIGAWESVGKLESPLSISAAEPVGCSVLLVGGLDDATGGPYSDRVLRGSVLKDGTFRTEKALAATVTTARGHVHQTPVYKKFLYSVGGRGNDGSVIGNIDIGTIEHP